MNGWPINGLLVRNDTTGYALVSVLMILLLLAGCGGEQDDSTDAASSADQMAEMHEGDTPEATAAAREPMLPVTASTVAYGSTDAGDSMTGYAAAPSRPDSVLDARGLDPATTNLPGLIVIHEWWGLNDNIRTTTRRLAGEGYRVLAVDLYGGAVGETPEEARDLMQLALEDRDLLRNNLRQAHEYLRTEADAPRVAVMGWCFGGGMALEAAISQPETLNGAVIYYGSLDRATEETLRPIEFPILGLFGGQDQSIPVENVRAFEQTLNDLGTDAEIHIYDDAGHAFANPSGSRYDAEAAAQAWDETTDFLRRTLYEPLGSE